VGEPMSIRSSLRIFSPRWSQGAPGLILKLEGYHPPPPSVSKVRSRLVPLWGQVTSGRSLIEERGPTSEGHSMGPRVASLFNS